MKSSISLLRFAMLAIISAAPVENYFVCLTERNIPNGNNCQIVKQPWSWWCCQVKWHLRQCLAVTLCSSNSISTCIFTSPANVILPGGLSINFHFCIVYRISKKMSRLVVKNLPKSVSCALYDITEWVHIPFDFSDNWESFAWAVRQERTHHRHPIEVHQRGCIPSVRLRWIPKRCGGSGCCRIFQRHVHSDEPTEGGNMCSAGRWE